jgi:pyruvate/2-oxoglutarate/acetoin dehydrogenase E1 component
MNHFGFIYQMLTLEYVFPQHLINSMHSSSHLFFLQLEREGKDVTITAFSKMVGYALQVCPQLVNM